MGKDLENFLTGLSPVSLPAPSAAHQQARAERPLPPPNIHSSPIHAGATDTAGTHPILEGPEHTIGVRTPQLRAIKKAGTAEPTEEPAGGGVPGTELGNRAVRDSRMICSHSMPAAATRTE